MSKLTENIVVKVSPEMKSFVMDRDSPSLFVRSLISRSMDLDKKIRPTVHLRKVNGDDVISFDESILHTAIEDVAGSIMKEVLELASLKFKK